MKKETIAILQNFATINQGILFRPGNAIRTLSVARNVYAGAVVDEDFKKEFAIYDLPEFLNTMAMFNEPQVLFEDAYIHIIGADTSVKYHYSSPNVVVAPPDKNPGIKGAIALEFTLTKAMLAGIEKAAAVMKLKEIKFDGATSSLLVFNRDNTGNEYKIDLKGCKGTGEALMKIDNLKMMADEYVVTVDDVSIHFVSPNGNDLTYVAVREAEPV